MLSCASVYCCLVVTCMERADLLALVVMSNCEFFPIGILGQVWYLIVSIPDLFPLSCFIVLICKGLDLQPIKKSLNDKKVILGETQKSK